jgi:hypothetical protein
MILVKSLHRSDPDVNQKHVDLQVPDIHGASFASAVRVNAVYSLPISLHLSLLSWYLSMCDGHMHWGSHVEVPNKKISKLFEWLFSIECSFPPRRPEFDSRPRYVSLGTTILDGDDLGQVFL